MSELVILLPEQPPLRLEDASATEVLVVTLLQVVLVLGTVRLLGPLPGTDRGGLWPLVVPEHYSTRVSGHPFDPYSINHVNHGIGGFLMAWLLGLDMATGLLFTIASSMMWEILENSDFVINRYRQYEGPSEHYEGDSKINAAFDVLSCGLGFAGALLASTWGGPWAGLAWFLGTETLMGLVWRDNMVLQIIQLTCHSSSIAAWQLEIVPGEYRSSSRLLQTLVPPGQDGRLEDKVLDRLERLGHTRPLGTIRTMAPASSQ